MDVVCKTVCLLCTITLSTGQFFAGVRIHFYQCFELVQMSLCTFIEIYYFKKRGTNAHFFGFKNCKSVNLFRDKQFSRYIVCTYSHILRLSLIIQTVSKINILVNLKKNIFTFHVIYSSYIICVTLKNV